MARKARGGWKNRKDPMTWAKVLERRRKRLAARIGAAVEDVTNEISDAAKLLAIPASKISRQDNPGGRPPRKLFRRTPVRSKTNRKAFSGIVAVTSFWTFARTKAIKDIYARYGLSKELERRWLYVKQRVLATNFTGVPIRGRKATKADYVFTGAYEKKFFNRDPRLRQWAMNVGQNRRHVTYLRNPKARRDLVLQAGINDAKPYIEKYFKEAVKAGLK
jgi:hypothetical protein